MSSRLSALAACCVALPLVAAQEGRTPVRELDLKAAVTPTADGRVDRPRVIATEAELTAAVPDGATRVGLVKQVNFEAEQLVLFTWTGSGRDTLTAEYKVLCSKSREAEVVFRYTPGGTADRTAHARLFAVPKEKRTTWRVETVTSK